MRTPFDHQIEGRDFLIKEKKVILADEMGLGKTYTTIMATLELGNRAVVIVPASLKTNWAREILAVDPEADIEIADAGEWYKYHDGEGSTWAIANYDIITRENIEKKILEHMPTTLILDEAHYIKGSSTIRTKKALEITEVATNVFLLTGTPIMNRPMELFSLLKAISHPLGDNWYGYAKTYCAAFRREFWRIEKTKDGKVVFDDYGRPKKKKYSFLDTSGSSNLDQLHEKIKDSFLRRTKDMLKDKLPDKIITNIEVEMTPVYRRKYETAWDDYIDYLTNIPQGEEVANIGNVEMAKQIIELNKLKQVASMAKIDPIVKDIESIVEQGDKVIIFTQYTNTLEALKIALKASKIKAVSLSGADNSTKRQKAIDSFQEDEKTKVFIANIKAGGVGITLTEASKVMFVDMEWTPALHSQAEDRAHRIGQKKLVNVYYYVAKGTVDEDIVELLEKKQQVITNILEGESMAKNKDITKKMIERMAKRGVIH